MKTKKLALIITMFILVCFIILGCANTSDSINEVRIAYFPNITHAQALVMKSERLLEKELDGISVKWISFNAGPSEIEALFAGEIDIGYIGPVPAVNGFVRSNGDLHIIAGASNGGSVLVAENGSGINSAADLDGKTVAVPQFGNTQHLSLLSLLGANGLKPVSSGGTVNVIQSSNADIANLMERKNIDAALVPEPWGSILELEHGTRVVLDYDEIDENGIPSTAVVIISKDFLTNHRDIAQAFIKAHKEATVYINNNDVLDIVNAQILEVTHNAIENDILESSFNRLEITYEIPEKSIMDFARASESEGFISNPPGDDIIDDTLIK